MTSKQELMEAEMRFLNESTGIGFIFSLGKWIGFLVGVIICYQIINADSPTTWANSPRLKAMGYGNRYFVGLVMQEAVFLSVLSFIPGLAGQRRALRCRLGDDRTDDADAGPGALGPSWR